MFVCLNPVIVDTTDPDDADVIGKLLGQIYTERRGFLKEGRIRLRNYTDFIILDGWEK